MRCKTHQPWELVFVFQVLFERPDGNGIETLYVEAPDEDGARERVKDILLSTPHPTLSPVEAERALKINVGPGRPIVDWSTPVFDLKKTALYLHCSYSQVSALMGAGTLPKANEGKPLFPQRTLARVVAERMKLEEAA